MRLLPKVKKLCFYGEQHFDSDDDCRHEPPLAILENLSQKNPCVQYEEGRILPAGRDTVKAINKILDMDLTRVLSAVKFKLGSRNIE